MSETRSLSLRDYARHLNGCEILLACGEADWRGGVCANCGHGKENHRSFDMVKCTRGLDDALRAQEPPKFTVVYVEGHDGKHVDARCQVSGCQLAQAQLDARVVIETANDLLDPTKPRGYSAGVVAMENALLEICRGHVKPAERRE